MSDDEYAIPESGHAKVPHWIIILAILLFLWGIVAFYLSYNGPWAPLDPGHWRALEEAANTTFG